MTADPDRRLALYEQKLRVVERTLFHLSIIAGGGDIEQAKRALDQATQRTADDIKEGRLK